MTGQLLIPRKIKGYGWRPDLPDFRDFDAHEAFLASSFKPVPPDLRKFSLRPQTPEPPYDQGQLGSCTGNGIAGAVQFRRAAQGLPSWRPSRLFIYYWERFVEGTVNEDSGAMIRDGIKVVNKYGAPPETDWPYDIGKFTQQPPAAVETEGQAAQVLKYARVAQTLAAIKLFIYNGYPVVKGFSVYSSFESDAVAKTGRMPIPQRGEQLLGGHCTDWWGWDDDAPIPGSPGLIGALEDRNSWGTGWGDGGYFYTPYVIATNRRMTSDLWAIEIVES